MIFNFREELGKMTPKIVPGVKIYIFGAGTFWLHICKMYKYLVNIDINACIDGFIDNDKSKQGTLFLGKPVYDLSDIALENAVILISVSHAKGNCEISWQLTNMGMYWRHSFFTFDCFTSLLMRWEYLRLMQFKDKHKGQRCFIIGNGPSLLASDLEKLKNEISFATNKIYLMFDQTSWRPSYYVIGDDRILRRIHRQIKQKIKSPRFYAFNVVFDIEDFCLNNDYFYFLDGNVEWKPVPFAKPTFSEEPFILQVGQTVTYECLQLAAYMGFGEIYLLGVDNNYSSSINNAGYYVANDVKEHFSASYDASIYIALIDIQNAAYETALEYADKHGIKIYNATRGGKLEVFQRVDFDSLF
jgi:hypothetical protein